MKQIEHDAIMDELEKKKRNAQILIVLVLVAFAIFFVFVRPLLKVYI